MAVEVVRLIRFVRLLYHTFRLPASSDTKNIHKQSTLCTHIAHLGCIFAIGIIMTHTAQFIDTMTATKSHSQKTGAHSMSNPASHRPREPTEASAV